MYFGFTEDEKLTKNSIHRMFQNEYPIEKVRKFVDEPTFSNELHQQICEMGFTGILSKDGEKFENIMHLLAVFEEAGKALIPYPLIESVVGTYALSLDSAKSEVCDSVMSGEQLLTVAWESNGEPYAIAQNDGYAAYGSFYGVPFAGNADLILAFFRIKGTNNKPSTESVPVIVNRNHPSVHVTSVQSMDMTYPLYNVEISNYPFTSKEIVNAGVESPQLKREMENLAALFASAEMLGMADEVLNKTVEYTKLRKQFGQEIAKFQALKHMAADMFVMVESCRSAVMYAGWAAEQGVEPETISIAKAYTSQSSMTITGMAIQMHGGIGYTWECEMHMYFKRARRTGSHYGDPYLHRERLMKQVVKEVGM